MKDAADISTTSPLTIKQIDRLTDLSRDNWNRLTDPSNPFLNYYYLEGLERHGCLKGHGWQPLHLIVFENETPVAALPNYLKDNSYGEFVFDWSWADAFERAGGHYYPKLVSTIPFAPIIGRRLLVDKERADQKLLKEVLNKAVIQIVESHKLSSFHCLFPEAQDLEIFQEQNLLTRMGYQYHWHNQGYESFSDFLDTLTSKKRKQIKRERRQVDELNVKIEVLHGSEISPDQWHHFYDFYCATFHRRWGSPRLTYDFFLSLSENMPDETLLILASKDSQYIAGAFAMIGESTLYGRHWGCSTPLPNLHFELCYYQTIEYCIKHGLKTLDAGVQGEHKLNRGFEPVVTWSNHWVSHDGFKKAINDFLTREKTEVDHYIKALFKHLPYKQEFNKT